MTTIKQIERIGTRLPGRHMTFSAWARPMTQGVVLAGFASTDNSTGVSAREHRHR